MSLMFQTQGEVRLYSYPVFQGIVKSGKPRHSFAGYDGRKVQDEVEAEVFSLKNYEKPKKRKASTSPIPLMGEQNKFHSFDFIQDHTILTNVEDYANRVRQDADEYREKVRQKIDVLRKEAESINAQAKNLMEKTEAETEAMISAAKSEVDDIKSKAYQEGYDNGYGDGRKKALTEGKDHFDKMALILNEIKKLRLSLFKQHEHELVSICLVMARMVVGNELKTNQGMVLDGIKRIIKQFEGMGKVKIRLNPVDFDFVMNHREMFDDMLDEEQKLSLKKDEIAGPGAPIIESQFNTIDLDIKKQFSVLDAAFKKCADERAVLYRTKINETDGDV